MWASLQGASVLFFPEGTRSKDGKMASFKKVLLIHTTSFLRTAGIPVMKRAYSDKSLCGWRLVVHCSWH